MATLARCSIPIPTTFGREVVSKPEPTNERYRDADFLLANWWNAANEVGLPPVNDPLGGSKQGKVPVSIRDFEDRC